MQTKTLFFTAPDWQGKRSALLDIFMGGVAVLGFAPFHIFPLTLLSFAYLFLRLQNAAALKRAGRAGFNIGLRVGFGFFLFGMYWIGSAFLARGAEFILLMPPMILGLVLLLSLFWGIAGGLFARLSRSILYGPSLSGPHFSPQGHKPQGGRLIISAILFINLFFLAEYARGHLFGGLPWNLPGYIFKAGGAISQSASIVGIYGLNLIVMILSVCLAISIMKWMEKPLNALFPGLLGMGIFLSLFVFGHHRISQADVQFVPDVNLRIVQVDFLQKDQFDPNRAFDITNEFIRTSYGEGLEGVSHIIWPEGAVSGLLLENPNLINAMGATLTRSDGTAPYWLFNSLRREQKINGNGGVNGGSNGEVLFYNSSVAMGFDKGSPRVVGYEDKVRLVPFGEFIPFERVLKSIVPQSLSTSIASMTPGGHKKILDLPGLPPVSAQICYEGIFSGLTPIGGEGASPSWILNQSNDAWYGRSIGPYQHANQVSYRAIEQGLPIIRATVNGISGSIDAYGRYVSKLQKSQTQYADVKLPRQTAKPLFSQLIYKFMLLLNVIGFILCLVMNIYIKCSIQKQ